MSERLTPEQELEMRVRMGSEVQGIAQSVSGALPRDPDTIQLAEQMLEAGKALGLSFQITCEDRLRGAIVEACTWLQQGAPGCALQVLENALKL